MPKNATVEGLLARRPPAPVADWYKIVNQATPEGVPTRALVRIYDAIGGWFGTNASDFVRELDAMDVDELDVHVNSPGGAVWDGLAIMNSLKAHRARVTVTVDGLAASAASIVAMGGDTVVMAEGSQLMIHRASGGAWGNGEYLRQTAGILDKIDGNMAAIYARKAGGTSADWLELMTAETWYDAAEAVAAGLADRADAAPEPEDAEASFDLSMFTYAGRDHAPAPAMLASVRAMAPGLTKGHVFGFAADTTIPQAAAQSPVSSEPGNRNNRKDGPLMEEFLSDLRQRLGLDAEAVAEDIITALDQRIAAPVAPEGTTLIDTGVLDGLQADAAAGRQAREDAITARRDGVIATALREGRITKASAVAFRAQLDVNEEGAVAILSTLPPNSAVPVDSIGFTGGVTESSDDDSNYTALFGSKEA